MPSTRNAGRPGAARCSPSILDVEDLAVTFRSEAGDVSAVRGISLSGAGGRSAGHCRRVGIGQVGFVAGGHGSAAGECARDGIGSLSRARPGGAERSRAVGDSGPPHLDDFSGPAVGADAGLHRRRPDRRGSSGAQRRDAAGGACAGRRAADARWHSERRAAGVGVSARVFGRHAPARDDCDGDGQPARRDHRRRTDDRARRHDPGADSRRAQDGQRGDRRGDRAHHARSRCRRRIRRPCRRDVRRAHRRNRRCGRRVLPAADAVHTGTAGIDSAARRRTQAAPHADRWQPPLARAPALGMPVLAAVPAAHREVSAAGARAAADPGTRSLASRGVPPQR